jgi:hypothetical protein
MGNEDDKRGGGSQKPEPKPQQPGQGGQDRPGQGGNPQR